MPKHTFLRASSGVRICKKYEFVDGELVKHSYPHILHFDSIIEKSENLKEFASLLRKHSRQGNCLLKGNIKRDLVNERRAGATDALEPTAMFCFDVDGTDHASVEDFIKEALPECFHTCSYVFAYSSGYLVQKDKKLRAHIWFQASEAQAPAVLKELLKHINLTKLEDQITLNKVGTALKWPLDITTCQNDKLIYISTPEFGESVTHFEGQRINYKSKSSEVVELDLSDVSPQKNSERAFKLINQLRGEAGFARRRKDSFKTIQDTQVLRSPGQAQVTGEKEERGFVYLNLNGGDSWGYYYPIDNPTVLYNFKGEPNYLLKDILPGYTARRLEQLEPEPELNADEIEYFAVIDRNTNHYYVGIYNQTQARLDMCDMVTARVQVADFMKEHGQPKPDVIPRWHVGYNFQSSEVFCPEKKYINLFVPTPYMEMRHHVPRLPRNAGKLLNHILAGEEVFVKHYLNWISYVFQTRKLAGTAWLFWGTQGTGKGVWFNKVLTPLFGKDHVNVVSGLSTFEAQFNGFMENTILLLVNEVQFGELHNKHTAMNRVKQCITDSQIPIRRMRTDQYMVINNVAMHFFSNQDDPVAVDLDDRRFNMPNQQFIKLLKVMSALEIKQIKDELESIAAYLNTFKYNKEQVHTTLVSKEAERLKEISHSAVKLTGRALLSGDLDFFFEYRADKERPEVTELALQDEGTEIPTYSQVLMRMIESEGEKINLSRAELRVLFYHVDSLQNKSRHKFSQHMAAIGLHLKAVKVNGVYSRGLQGLEFKISSPEVRELIAQWVQKQKQKEKVALRRVK